MLNDHDEADARSMTDPLNRAIASLADEFVGVFAPETVERLVRDSYRQLSHESTIHTYLPLLAQRFARERLLATRRAQPAGQQVGPGLVFVCAHNSGRSQMAAGWVRHLAPELDVWSAGTEPAGEVSAAVIEVMREAGIELDEGFPKPLTDEVIAAADIVVTMGCGEACPVVPGRRYEDWILAHPVGPTIDNVRSARDEIRERVEGLLSSMVPAR